MRRNKRGCIVRLFVLLGAWFVLGGGSVRADMFGAAQDTAQCKLGITQSISVSKLPESPSIIYDKSKVVGFNPNFISQTNFNTLANIFYPDAHRYLNIGAEVKAPPLSTIDVGLYWYNFSGHDIFLRNGFLFLSSNQGDVCRLIKNSCSLRTLSFRYNGRVVIKTAKGLNVSLNKPIAVNNGTDSGIKIASLQLRQPLKFKNERVSYQYTQAHVLLIFFDVDILNDSDYGLSNVLYEHHAKDFYKRRLDFRPHETKHVHYFMNYGLDYPLEIDLKQAKVTDFNEKKECIVMGSSSPISYYPNARMFFVERNDIPNYPDWFGFQPDLVTEPAKPNFCINLLPYSVLSSRMNLHLEPDLSIDTFVNNKKAVRLKSGDNAQVSINVKNNGARADDMLVKVTLPKNFHMKQNDCGLKRIEDYYVWEVGSMYDHTSVNCSLSVKVLDEDLKIGENNLLINSELYLHDKKALENLAQVNIFLWHFLQLNQSYQWISDDRVQFLVRVDATGNSSFKKADLQNECKSCSSGTSLVSADWATLTPGENNNVRIKSYLLKFMYKVKDKNNYEVTNCFYINTHEQLAPRSLSNCKSVVKHVSNEDTVPDDKPKDIDTGVLDSNPNDGEALTSTTVWFQDKVLNSNDSLNKVNDWVNSELKNAISNRKSIVLPETGAYSIFLFKLLLGLLLFILGLSYHMRRLFL